ncbi:HAMP domain-containing histidine kinase [Nodosilinea sp. P-1105]|uniref:sensor histidine kinase n=1 Tax=Nodosilinea sp. P-1105 TaxID=2546229 RepID=UPI001469E53E|nr:HAMP domain-containing histidine kinase [Nodosilinea sp. P-1105]NMF83671.1 HAMP domain-containing histidine kinase [Nodosilinea sp. P-1105]
MSLPAIDQFLTQAPSYTLDTPLGTIAQDWRHQAVEGHSHLIVVDAQRRPMGSLALGCLWAAATDVTLAHLEADLEPIVQVTAPQTLAELWPLMTGVNSQVVVVVDRAMTYQGVVSADRLLGWVARHAKMTDQGLVPMSASAASPLAQDNLGWVVDLSHALKTPITTLLGLSTLLLDSRLGSLSDRQFRYVVLMRQAVRKIMTLVNQLLDWLRLESDQLPLHLEALDLEAFITDLVPSFLATKSEDLVVDEWPQQFKIHRRVTPPVVMADALRLRQGLHYALDSLMQQGFEPRYLEIDDWGRWLGLTLAGQSPAPDPATQPFQMPPSSEPKRIAPDALDALGLTLAQRLVQLHGGDLCELALPDEKHLTLLLPMADQPLPLAQPDHAATVLVGIVGQQPQLIAQAHQGLQDSRYRLISIPNLSRWTALQQRLPLAGVILCEVALPVEGAVADQTMDLPWRLGADCRPQGIVTLGSENITSWHGIPAMALPPDGVASGLKAALDDLIGMTSWPAAVSQPPGLTLLLLSADTLERPTDRLSTNLQAWLQHYHCRLLQVDNLTQASVLSRVWQPDGIILLGAETLGADYLQALAQCPELAPLPLVTFADVAQPPSASDLGLRFVPCAQVVQQPPQLGSLALIRAVVAARRTG